MPKSSKKPSVLPSLPSWYAQPILFNQALDRPVYAYTYPLLEVRSEDPSSLSQSSLSEDEVSVFEWRTKGEIEDENPSSKDQYLFTEELYQDLVGYMSSQRPQTIPDEMKQLFVFFSYIRSGGGLSMAHQNGTIGYWLPKIKEIKKTYDEQKMSHSEWVSQAFLSRLSNIEKSHREVLGVPSSLSFGLSEVLATGILGVSIGTALSINNLLRWQVAIQKKIDAESKFNPGKKVIHRVTVDELYEQHYGNYLRLPHECCLDDLLKILKKIENVVYRSSLSSKGAGIWNNQYMLLSKDNSNLGVNELMAGSDSLKKAAEAEKKHISSIFNNQWMEFCDQEIQQGVGDSTHNSATFGEKELNEFLSSYLSSSHSRLSDDKQTWLSWVKRLGALYVKQTLSQSFRKDLKDKGESETLKVVSDSEAEQYMYKLVPGYVYIGDVSKGLSYFKEQEQKKIDEAFVAAQQKSAQPILEKLKQDASSPGGKKYLLAAYGENNEVVYLGLRQGEAKTPGECLTVSSTLNPEMWWDREESAVLFRHSLLSQNFQRIHQKLPKNFNILLLEGEAPAVSMTLRRASKYNKTTKTSKKSIVAGGGSGLLMGIGTPVGSGSYHGHSLADKDEELTMLFEREDLLSSSLQAQEKSKLRDLYQALKSVSPDHPELLRWSDEEWLSEDDKKKDKKQRPTVKKRKI